MDFIAANPGTFITGVFLPQVAVGYAIAETAWGLLSPLVSEVAVDYSNLQGAGCGRVGAGLISLVDVAGRPVEWLVLNALSEGRNREGQKLSALERVGYGVVGTIGTAGMFYAPARAIQVGIFAGVGRLGAGSVAGGLVEAELAEAAAGSASSATRTFTSFDALKRGLGSAGEGNVWHHIVEQRAANLNRFGGAAIHSTENAVAVSAKVNQAIANYYSRIRPFTGGQTVRKWLGSQSFEQQLQFGREILDLFLSGGSLP